MTLLKNVFTNTNTSSTSSIQPAPHSRITVESLINNPQSPKVECETSSPSTSRQAQPHYLQTRLINTLSQNPTSPLPKLDDNKGAEPVSRQQEYGLELLSKVADMPAPQSLPVGVPDVLTSPVDADVFTSQTNFVDVHAQLVDQEKNRLKQFVSANAFKNLESSIDSIAASKVAVLYDSRKFVHLKLLNDHLSGLSYEEREGVVQNWLQSSLSPEFFEELARMKSEGLGLPSENLQKLFEAKDTSKLIALTALCDSLHAMGYDKQSLTEIARIGGLRVLAFMANPQVITDTGFLTPEQREQILGQKGGDNNMRAVIEYNNALDHLGFTADDIFCIAAHCRGADNIKTIIEKAPVWRNILSAQDAAKLVAGNNRGANTLEFFLENHARWFSENLNNAAMFEKALRYEE